MKLLQIMTLEFISILDWKYIQNFYLFSGHKANLFICLKYSFFFQIDNQPISVNYNNPSPMTFLKIMSCLGVFSVSESSVKNIDYTWIIFMSKQWQAINMWPSSSLV